MVANKKLAAELTWLFTWRDSSQGLGFWVETFFALGGTEDMHDGIPSDLIRLSKNSSKNNSIVIDRVEDAHKLGDKLVKFGKSNSNTSIIHAGQLLQNFEREVYPRLGHNFWDD